MRIHIGLILSGALLALPLSAQVSRPLPGCEPSSPVRKILDERLSDKALEKLKFNEALAVHHQVLQDLMSRYPREIEPGRRWIDYARENELDELSSLQERFQKQAQASPKDPLALDLAALALWHKDTDESLRLLESVKTLAPNFPWPYLDLANILSEGKRADKQKSGENLARFYSLCPGATDPSWVQDLLSRVGDAALQARVAADLRARLLHDTTPERLRDYQTLWALEFRVRPPQEHDALRKQIAEDLKRLEKLNPKPKADWLAFLLGGYKQSGASQETITRMEDRLLSLYPRSSEAYQIVVAARWRKSHKEPEDSRDANAWNQYIHAQTAVFRKWIADYPEQSFLAKFRWFFIVNEDESVSKEERLAAVETYIKATDEESVPAYRPYNYINAVEFLLRNNWQPERALDLLHQISAMLAKEDERTLQDDNLSPQQLDEQKAQSASISLELVGLTLKAAKLAGKPEEAKTVETLVEGPLPEKKYQTHYWWNRARLADLEGRKADALAYYRLALQDRGNAPKRFRGKLQDPLGDEARAEWKELGGSEDAWALWSKPPENKAQEATEGRWEKPKKELPAFELADLSGKTWRLKELGGKTLLINVWATWCVPCQGELPHLQKLYTQLKDRSDVQILTFNVDEELGLVAPYLKEKGYTFPVLSAHNFVYGLLDSIVIPRNWIVDPKGAWQWEQLGYGPDPDWESAMIKRLEAAKAGK